MRLIRAAGGRTKRGDGGVNVCSETKIRLLKGPVTQASKMCFLEVLISCWEQQKGPQGQYFCLYATILMIWP